MEKYNKTSWHCIWQWFLEHDLKGTSNKEKKSDFAKFCNFCASVDDINRVKRQSTEWKKVFINHTSDKG